MLGLPLAFGAPLVLFALLALPIIWYLLRLTPPKPNMEVFPPTRILSRLLKREETPAQSPWWLTLLRLLMAACVILAMALPFWNPQEATLSGDGPVMVVLDDGWASGQDWKSRKEAAASLIAEAREANRLVLLQRTAQGSDAKVQPLDAEAALQIVDGLSNSPIEPDHEQAAAVLSSAIINHAPGSLAILSDGLQREGTRSLFEAAGRVTGQKLVITPDVSKLVALSELQNQPGALEGNLIRIADSDPFAAEVTAFDVKGVPIARRQLTFEAGQAQVAFQLDEPVELRNQIARIAVTSAANAAAVKLLDESNRRRLVGLVSGEKRDLSQPLLSPLYYISRALEPFSDLRQADSANVSDSVSDLINQGVSTIVLADVGLIPEQASEDLTGWINKGGMLIRFAGPRMAANPEGDLLPVQIRQGDRNLGSALSWETPKPVDAFEPASPFYGLERPNDVSVTRQVLALQEVGLADKTWATLEDGTPLVTAEQRGSGWVVLFHVSSDATWSNLPISGTFVEMLRRTVNLSKSTGTGASPTDVRLPPLRLLDGQGNLTAPSVEAKPLVLRQGENALVSLQNPPGFYGTEDGFTALNLFDGPVELARLDTTVLSGGTEQFSYQDQPAIELRPWLLLAAALMLVLDCLAVLWIAGALRGRLAPQALGLLVGIGVGGAVLLIQTPSLAQQGEFDFAAALQTRLAYVITGNDSVDEISRAGMSGLTQFIASRTALEPGPPVGLEMASDELAFYSLIYWPIEPGAPLPDAQTMARVDAFMKQGGSILFDTRDQVSGALGGTSASPAAQYLQALLSSLDIPPLEPVPDDHVLTKAFYLLDSFPGRFAGGELWVEALTDSKTLAERPARAGDGVSSILITSNDFAGAWAVDSTGQSMLPTIPSDPIQRNYAFRVGVNLMMYTLTGNYKADQVHIPALLERLGQ